MRVYVEAYDKDGKQILGNLDGQRSWEGRDYTRTNWYKCLGSARMKVAERVAYWHIVNSSGKVLETVRKAGT